MGLKKSSTCDVILQRAVIVRAAVIHTAHTRQKIFLCRRRTFLFSLRGVCDWNIPEYQDVTLRR